ncbi:MAG: substrate-binding domain-containing protein [Oscillospiraceae bacterium]|jgi:simple sugar transport system substrate-binding protein|nr:substrate-binding domain-containing protein [Oscillospiraceae bacterium]
MKKVLSLFLVALLAVTMLAGCGETTPPAAENTPAASNPAVEVPPADNGNDKLVVGFAQIGQESGWRDAETNDIMWYAAQNIDTIELHFADAQQKQENQINAIKAFIDMGVDVIGLPPVVSTGWDAIFAEANEAGIPIILVDRNIEGWEDMEGVTFIGSDVILEGQNAAEEIATLLGGSGNIVELQGTVGSSAANDRYKGFHDRIEEKYPDIKVLDSQSGDFTRAGGKQVMESFLKTYPGQIDAIYAHNDDMVLGAIEAIKEAGLRPGEDIKTVSCDGVRAIFEAMIAGEANVTVECSPLLAAQFFQAAQDLKDGKSLPKFIQADEDVYRRETAEADLPNRKY